MFDLNTFLATPSFDQINSFCKDDVVKIADHFGITYSRQSLKMELKSPDGWLIGGNGSGCGTGATRVSSV